MRIRRTLLPLWCAAFAVAGAFAFTVQVAEPASPVPGHEERLLVPAPTLDGSCAAVPGEFSHETSLDSPAVERLLCVDTTHCGDCCGPRGQLKKFWQCCNSGGGLECAALCRQY